MNEIRMIRGTDIRLYADQTPLFGVTAFSAEQKTRFHEVYEYLNAKPCERIPQGTYYTITLQMMTLFDRQLPQDDFTLDVEDGDTTYRFEHCRVTLQQTKIQGNGHAAAVFTVEADSMRRQVTQDE